MKTKFLLLLVLICQVVTPLTAGVKAVFPYDYPYRKALYSLSMKDTPKGRAYLEYLLYASNLAFMDTAFSFTKGNLQILFDNLYSEELFLQDQGYMNSGYDDVAFKMVPSVGHSWKGFVWVLRLGSYIVPLIKTDCGNILVVKAERLKPTQVIPRLVETQTPPVVYKQPKRVVEERPKSVVFEEVHHLVAKPIFVETKKGLSKELKIGMFVIPVSAIVVGALIYLSKNNQSDYREERGRTRPPTRGGGNNGGPVDSDPSGGGDDGGPVDSDPSGGGDDGGPVDSTGSGG